MIFTQILQKKLKLSLILQILNQIGYYQKEKKKSYSINERLGGKIITKCVGLRAKTYGYLIDDGSEDKKAKGTKQCVIKRKLKFENYENCLDTTRLENKIKYLEKQ